MRTIPTNLSNWLATKPDSIVMADLVTLTLVDGVTIYRWTNSEIDLTVGGNFFRVGPSVNAPGVTVGQFVNQLLPAVDTCDVTLTGGTFLIGGMTMAQLAVSGFFDGARLRHDHLMGPDLATAVAWGGISSLFEGRVGMAEPQGANVILHCDGETITLQQQRPLIVLQPSCNYSVYDPNCGLSRAAFTLSGTASGTPTTTSVPTATAAITAKAAGYFDLGVITFSSGVLNGQSFDVEHWDGTNLTIAGQPMPVAPSAGDTFSVYPGCDLTRAKCTTLGNLGTSGHWRGFDRIPSPESGN